MRGVANVLLALGFLVWLAGFHFGPGNGLLWRLAGYTPVAIGIALFLHIFAFLLPSSRPVRNPVRKAEPRKCRTCGRPAIPGSDYCRYHTDEQRAMGGGDSL